jgi:hypothetical protein
MPPYFTTQKAKDEYEAKRREALKNFKPEAPKPSVATAPAKPKKKRYTPPSGFKLGDAMPESLRKVGLEYRNSHKRDKIRKSFNKGDQRNVKRQNT